MHYENIKKVYSIWICQDVLKDREHSIVAYEITERVIKEYRKFHPEPVVHYDLMSVVIIGLGDPDAEGADEIGEIAVSSVAWRAGCLVECGHVDRHTINLWRCS